MSDSLRDSIAAQRKLLADLLGTTMASEARRLALLLKDQATLDEHLQALFLKLDYCKYVFVLDKEGIQISSTINRFGADEEQIGRDRSQRPYMDHMTDPNIDFVLSEAYISRNKKRPSMTAIQTIRDGDGMRVGFLGVDYD